MSDAAQRIGSASEVVNRLRDVVRVSLQGKERVVDLALTALFAEGHLLLQDVPGVGKTTLAASVAGAVGGSFSRVQFTADLLPGDLTGVNVLDPQGPETFLFHRGPLFANIVLADEINRTTPKTQSALFEAMEEHCVTVDGCTHPLPSPYMVLATQNPYDFHGTFQLPDSQLDRFLMRISIGYPSRDVERDVMRQGGRTPVPEPVVELDQVRRVIDTARRVSFPFEVEDYLIDLVRTTRIEPRLIRGVSPRGAQALYRACRAWAMVHGRSFVIPEDVRDLAVPVLAHRVVPRTATGGRMTDDGELVILEILDRLDAPG